MVNPTIEEAGHYFPEAGKCQICIEWWGIHSIEEQCDHGMKILDWFEKKEKEGKKTKWLKPMNKAKAKFYFPFESLGVLCEYEKAKESVVEQIASGEMREHDVFLHVMGKLTVKQDTPEGKELRKYFKNIPPIKGSPKAKLYFTLTKEQRRERQQERMNRKDQKADRELMEIMRKMKYEK